MLLAIDIGNTNIVLGLYQGKELITHWRLLTQAERTADEYGVIISHLVASKGFRCHEIHSIVASCVVPPMVSVTQELAGKFFEIEPLMVGPGIKTGMPILYDSPKDVGADRIVNGIAAYEKYHDTCIVVDFGTATTLRGHFPACLNALDFLVKRRKHNGAYILPHSDCGLSKGVQGL
jgi:type III pantothenate kinase